jgi:hypothetical protein
MLGDRKLTYHFALANMFAIITNCFGFVLEIEPQHLLRFVGDLNCFGPYRRHGTQIVDLAGNNERMLKLFGCMLLQLIRDVHILRAFEHLRIDDVGNYRLILACEILIEPRREFFASDGLSRRESWLFNRRLDRAIH